IATKQNHECNFLVRPSESTVGEISLTVKLACIGDVQHFKILRDPSGRYFLWSSAPRFNSVNKLVEHYKKNSVSNNGNVPLRE
ncbi:hypothetical protein HELRODRAFT_137293, partial [Helobdella robusta]|uniref:SH2 domain-containing protein n=1 Tax=Helobdella robusta TaxID=6412 RepID=T1EIJ1_HELRO